MRYRDLIPDRQGGRFIASHIVTPGGPVPDYVHFHRVRFQMIYCYKGWVRVVYEDQGPPFVMQAGTASCSRPRSGTACSRASPGLEVIEIGCPAEHETRPTSSWSCPRSPYGPIGISTDSVSSSRGRDRDLGRGASRASSRETSGSGRPPVG